MAPEATPSKGGGMLSLYANLLDPEADASSTPGTISRAPVVFKQSPEGDSQPDESAAKKQQINSAALRFQPTKRPQISAQKPKPKPTLPRAVPGTSPAPTSSADASASNNAAVRAPVKTTLADWAATDDDDVNGFYGERRQRGGRKKRKKNREAETVFQNWDDIYDPSRPNIYEEYKHSEEKIREVREWKDRLYAHRMASRNSSAFDSDEESSRPMNRQFAPPPGLNFAPPADLNKVSPPPEPPTEGPPPEPAAPLPDDPTGDDAYARRLRMSGILPAAGPSEPQPPKPPSPAPQPARSLSSIQAPSATISRAPVRYSLPPPPEDIPASEAELEETFAKEQPVDEPEDGNAPRSLRPGQKGFAERLLAKYGWSKGSGLGATGSGIVKPLQVKVEKQKKKPDSEGGGFVGPGGRGKIIGGAKKSEDEGKFGAMSEVIVLRGMLDGLDLDAELESSQDGGLMQEIGEECAEKYGRVERVFIHRNAGDSVPVFVKFTSQLSALRAVNALEGRIFNGNKITARFFNNEKFEKGIYE
ncbi:hypothetical protein DTO166G4_2566 [Paecilomyces variotii]|nr:hypothetical protein DTO166G4_2566 [Paecilomyces variotii]KAJ9240350.1 hypothetical protein DTO166G5_1688 [Paecilomyces variotii]KAJ9351944.1 hypothetical protein DTO027B9_6075 [Paecilomyces variotii]